MSACCSPFAVRLLAVATAVLLFAAPSALGATTLTVSKTDDVITSTGACGNAAITTAPSELSLREATCVANNLGGEVTIVIPAGTYRLAHGELKVGTSTGSDITLDGAGAASTIIDAGRLSRVLQFDPGLVGGVTSSVSDLTITGGLALDFGGGGIIAGAETGATADVLTITNTTVTDNQANMPGVFAPGKLGGGVAFRGGRLTVTNSIFSKNRAYGANGSALAYSAVGSYPSPESLTVTNTTFSDNSGDYSSANNRGGGTLYALGVNQAGKPTTPMSITGSRFTDNTRSATIGTAVGAGIYMPNGAMTVTGNTFTNNTLTTTGTADSAGAAVYAGFGAATVNYNRFSGNTSAAGASAVGLFTLATPNAAVDASRNWWGCNAGPNTANCDDTSGTMTGLAPWLTFHATASPTTLTGPNATSTVTAGLTKDSAGNAVTGSLLSGLDGTSVPWSDITPSGATVSPSPGSLSAGVATATYNTRTASGSGHVVATLDNQTATTPTLTVNQAPAVTTNPSDQNRDSGQTATFTAAASGYPTPTVQWQKSTDGGGSYANIAGATSTTYSFTAAVSDHGSRYRAVFTNSTSTATTTAATLTVGSAPTITSADSIAFTRGTAGSFTVRTTANPTAALASTGTLPTGVTFTDNNDGTATIAGTPTQAGSFPLTITASNGRTPNASQSFTLSVRTPPAFTSANNATFVKGTEGSFTVTTSAGFPAARTLTKSGTLPAGVTFTDTGNGTAKVEGTPTAGGTFTLTITASNGVDPDATQTFTLTVNHPPSITSADHATFVKGTAGSFDVTTGSGLPAATTISKTGSMPAGVTFTDERDGTATIAGTPTETGEFTFTIKASNGISPDTTQTFTLSVRTPPAITSADHVTFVKGTEGSFNMTTSAGFPTARTLTKTGALPAGVTFTDNGDGTAKIEGTPTASGTFTPTITASNGVNPDATQTFTLTVQAPPAITSPDHATFEKGTAGSFDVTTSAGFPAARALTKTGALPAGVTFTDNGDGTAKIAGTPTASGTFTPTIRASNGVDPDATQTFTLTVQAPPAITSADRTTFTAGTAGSFTVTTAPGVPATTTLTRNGTLPAGVTFADNGDGTATLSGTSFAPGTYPLTITAANGVAPNATQSFSFVVGKRSQAITITSAAPAQPEVGERYTLDATASSGLPVTVTVDPATTEQACTVSGASVSFEHAGKCVVAVDQAGNGDYEAAPRARQTMTVRAIPTAFSLTTGDARTVYGQTATATARASAPGTVQFSVDGANLGAPVNVGGDGTVSRELVGPGGAPLTPGSHAVSATFAPTDPTTRGAATASATQIVDPAATRLAVEVHPDKITAAVSVVAPGAGVPTGSVAFTVAGTPAGSADLRDGVATLERTVAPGREQQVAAAYAGDDAFTGSSGSTSRVTDSSEVTSRTDPSITASLSSRGGKSRFGWYRNPVVVRFTCASPAARLTGPCPPDVTLDRSAAAQTLTRTITTTDGGAATVVVKGIDIDRVAPTVRLSGVKAGSRARCIATDALSGVASCRVARSARGNAAALRAIATDRAGNSSRATASSRPVRLAIEGAPRKGNAFVVAEGRTYQLVVRATTRPVYYDAAVPPAKPTIRDRAFYPAGRHRWALGVTMADQLGPRYDLGVKIGKKMHIVRIVVGR